MKDINLFSIYEQRQSMSKLLYFVAVIAAVVIIALPFAYVYTLDARAKELYSATSVIQSWLDAPDVKQYLSEHDKLSARLAGLRDYSAAVERSIDSIEKIGTLSTEKLQFITDVLPRSVSIQSLKYDDRDLSLTLQLPYKVLAAETLLRLKGAESLESVTLGQISLDGPENEERYKMTVYCVMKGGVLR